MQKIAVLTSGGDSPGMNAAIRGVVRTSIYQSLDVSGIRYGYNGLFENQIEKMNVYSVADIVHRGGTFLYTARCEKMKTEEGVQEAAKMLHAHGIEGLIVIGGDGSYRGAQALSRYGINVCCIPGTIDNDIPATEFTIGFDTAVNTAIDAISKIRDTSHSHNRVNVVEVMGRNSGSIALYSGVAGGAEAICVPEISYDSDAICKKMLKGKQRGKLHSIIVFAEGAGDVRSFCKEIEEKSGVVTRTTTLGYIQRGGSPSAFDRVLASRMGAMAVYTLLEGKTNRAICIQKNRLLDMDINEALAQKRPFDYAMYETAMELSI